MRLAAVELLDEAAKAGRLDEPTDVIVATSLLSAADLRALLPGHLRRVPLVVYMHENQAAYPWSDHPAVDSKRDVHFALTNLTSALAADLVIWNSRWNKQSFLSGMRGLIGRASAVELDGWDDKVEHNHHGTMEFNDSNTHPRATWKPLELNPEQWSKRHSNGHGDYQEVEDPVVGA